VLHGDLGQGASDPLVVVAEVWPQQEDPGGPGGDPGGLHADEVGGPLTDPVLCPKRFR
jgi:hypothetical protein